MFKIGLGAFFFPFPVNVSNGFASMCVCKGYPGDRQLCLLTGAQQSQRQHQHPAAVSNRFSPFTEKKNSVPFFFFSLSLLLDFHGRIMPSI